MFIMTSHDKINYSTFANPARILENGKLDAIFCLNNH